MTKLREWLENNRKWAAQISAKDPAFFSRLANMQRPELLWIGCSDSRLPPNQIIGTIPGEVFVHRNVGNVVVHTDMNCLSVIQFAVDVLKVKHIIVCGHYGCGGVVAAMGSAKLGLIDNWLRHIKDVYRDHRDELDAIDEPEARADRLCEIQRPGAGEERVFDDDRPGSVAGGKPAHGPPLDLLVEGRPHPRSRRGAECRRGSGSRLPDGMTISRAGTGS